MRIAVSMVLCLVCSTTFAAQQFWGGGSGSWDTSTANWGATSGGPFTQTWTNGNDAVFGGAAAPVTITAAAGISAASISFASNNYTLAGSAVTLGTGGIAVSAGLSATITAVLTGTDGLNKTGPGVLELRAANTYGGATTVSGGTLRVGNGRMSPVQAWYPMEGTTKDASGVGHDMRPFSLSRGGSLMPTSSQAYNPGRAGFGQSASLVGGVAPSPNITYLATLFGADLGLNSYTASGWLQFNTNVAGTAGLLSTRDNASSATDMQINSTNVNGTIGTGATFLTTTISTVAPTNVFGTNGMAWHMVTEVVSCSATAKSYTIFVDGAQLSPGTAALSGNAVFNDFLARFCIGTSTGSLNFVYGQVDDVAIFNKPLTAADVSLLFTSGPGAFMPVSVIPDQSAVSIAGGAILDLSNSTEQIGALSGGGNVTLGSGRLIFGDGSNSTYDGVISSTTAVINANNGVHNSLAGGISKQGTGTAIFTANQAYLGSTVVSDGILQAGNGSGAGSIFQSPTITSHGTVVCNLGSSNASMPTGPFNGFGHLVWNGTGTLSLGAATRNFYYGNTTINAGKIAADGPNTLGFGIATVNNGGTLSASSGATTNGIRSSVVVNSGGKLEPGPATGGPGLMTLIGNLTLNPGAITTLNLNVPDNGVTSVGSDDEITLTAGYNLVLGGTLNVTNLGGMAAGTYRLFTLTAGTGSTSGSFSSINMPAGFTGTISITTANAVNLVVTANPGTRLFWEADTALDGSSWATNTKWHLNSAGGGLSPWINGAEAVIDVPGTIALGGSITANRITVNANGVNVTGANLLTLSSGIVDVSGGNSATISAQLTGAGGLLKAGSGTLVISNTANNYTGTSTVDAGTLTLGAAGVITDASPVIINLGATWNLSNFNELVAGISGRGDITLGTGTVTVNSALLLGHFGVISGTGGVIQAGTGTLLLGGANIYSGATAIQNGRLRLGASNAVPAGSTLQFGTAGGLNGILDINNFDFTMPAFTLLGGTANRVVNGFNNGGPIYSNPYPTLTFNITGSDVILGASPALILGNGVATSAINSNAFNVVKNGDKILQLASANTYIGTTTINQGTLRHGAANVIHGYASTVTVATGAVYDLNNFASTIGSLAGGGNVTMGTATLTCGIDSSSTTFSGVISGTGGLAKQGSGRMTFTADQTYTGATSIAAGGSIQMGDGGTAGFLATSSIANTGMLLYNLSTNKTFAGVISGGTASITTQALLFLNGTGSLTLTGNNTYNGGTIVNSGTLIANNATSSTGPATAPVVVNSGGIVSGTGRILGAVAVNNGGTYAPGNGGGGALTTGALTLNATSISIFELGSPDGGVAQGNGFDDEGVVTNLTLAGKLNIIALPGLATGIYRLFTYSGTLSNLMQNSDVTYPPGVSGSLIPGGGAVNISITVAPAGPTLYWTAGDGNWEAANAWHLGSPGGALTTWDNAQNYVAVISGDGVGGTITLGTNITASKVVFPASGGGYTVSGNTLALSGGTISVSTSSTALITSAIASAAGLSKDDAGILSLSGANTYLGTTQVKGGTLRVAGAPGGQGVIPDASSVIITSGAVLDLNSNSETIGMLSGAGDVALGSATLTENNSVNITYSGAISGTGGLTKLGIGILTLSGASTYGGTTTVSAGTLQLSVGANRLPSGTPISLPAATSVLDLNGQDQTLGNIVSSVVNSRITSATGTPTLTLNMTANATFAGILGTGAFNLVKSGAGALTLSAANTYTGTTTVNGGTLVAANSTSATGSGSVSIASGAILTGTGKITGAVAVNSGGAFAPGSVGGGGTLSTGALTLNASSISNFDLNAPDGGVTGVGSDDEGVVTGNLTLGGVLNITNLGGMSSGTYRLFTYSGTLSGSFAAFNPPSGFVGVIDATTPGAVNLRVIQAPGEVLYWNGGTGTWTAPNAWHNAGGTNFTWSNANNHVAVFDVATPGNITLGSNITADNIVFATSGYTLLTGNTLTLTAATIDVSSGNSGTVNAPISTVLNGNFIKVGAGTLSLGGINTWTADTQINAGTLAIASAPGGNGVIPNTSNVNLAAGAIFDLNGFAETIGALTGTGNVALGAATGALTVNASTNITYSGVISGSGSFTKIGTGTLTLAGASTYTGATAIQNGTIALSAGADRLPAATSLTLGVGAAAGTLNLNNQSQTLTGLVASGSVTNRVINSAIGATPTLTLNILSGDNVLNVNLGDVNANGFALTKIGPGTLTLASVASYTGPTNINVGTLKLGTGGASVGPQGIPGLAAYYPFNGDIHDVMGNLVDGNPRVYPSSNFTPTFPTKDGRQALFLNGASQFIDVPYSAAFQFTSYTVSGWGWQNNVPGADFPADIALIGTRYNQTNTMDLRFRTAGITPTVGYGDNDTGDPWANSTSFTMAAGTCPWQTAAGANQWHMLTMVVNSAPTKNIRLYVDGVYVGSPTWGNQAKNAKFMSTGPGGAGGNMTIGSVRSQDCYMNGYIDDLCIYNRALLDAEVSALYGGGASIAGGIPDVSAVTIAGGAVFDMNNFNDTIGSLTGTGSVTMGTGNLAFGGDNTSQSYGGVIAGTGGVTKQGTGQMTFTANQNFTGTTTVAAGALNCGTGGAGSIAPTTGIADAAALNFNLGSTSYSPAFGISGAGSLSWNGTGTLTLSGTNVLTAGVTISAGTLAGISTVGGPVNILSGASFRPGNGAGGKFTSGAMTLGSTASSFFRLKAPDNGLPNAGSDDEVQVNGNINVGGTVAITDAGGLADGNYRLFTYTGTLSGVFTGVSGPAGFIYTLDVSVPGAVNLLVSQLPGQALYWENGTGTWDTTTMNWRTVPGGAADTIWNNASNYVAIIRGTAGTITVGPALIRADNIVFQTNGFTVQTNQLSLTAGGASVSGSAVATINSVVVGNRGFAKNDTGTLILGAVNTYLGSSAVSGGTLRTAASATNNAIPNTSPITVAGGATFDLNNNNETTGALIGGGSVALGSGTLTVNNTISSVFTGVIGGSGGLVKTGAGMQTLSGVSTYGGSTAIQNGTLQIGSTNSLPVTTAVSLGTATTNGILDLNSQNQTVAGLTAVGAQCRVVNSVATTPTFTVNIAAGENQFPGTLGNTGQNGFNLTKIGAGTLTLFAANTYSGTTNVNGGTLKVGFTSVLQMPGLIAYYPFENSLSDATGTGHNGAMDVGTANYTAGRTGAGQALTLAGNGYAGVPYSSDFEFSDSPANTVPINAYTMSAWVFSTAAASDNFSVLGTRLGSSNFGNDIQLQGTGLHGVIGTHTGSVGFEGFVTTAADCAGPGWGTVWRMVTYVIDSDVANGVGGLPGPGKSIKIYIDGVFVAQPAWGTAYNGNAAKLLGVGNRVALGYNGQGGTGWYYIGQVDDIAFFNRALSATDVLALFSGGGTAGGVIPDTSVVTVASGARLDVNSATETIGPLSGTGDVTLGAGALTVNSLSNSTFGGVISGTGRIAKSNTFTQTLSGANTYTGTTTVENGTLQLAGGTNRLPAVTAVTLGSLNGNTGGVLDLNNQDQTIASLTSASTGVNRVVDSANDATVPSLTVNSATGTFSTGNVLLGNTNQNGFNFAKSGSGTLQIGPGHTYTGTTQINAGVLQYLGAAGSYLGDTTAVTVANGAALSLNNLGDMIGSLSGLGSVTLGSATLITGNDGTSTTYGGQILGTGGLSKIGAGTLTVTRDAAYTGATTIAGGTLQCGNGGTGGSIGTSVSMLNNAAFIFNMSTAMTFNGVISGTGSLTGNGTGVLTLGGANTFSGGTVFNAGTLNVTNTAGSGSGTSTVTMNTGSTLGGSGSISGVVSINGGAAYAPGNAGGGRLTTGQLTLAAGSSSNFELNTPDNGAANVGGDDEGVVNGNLTLAGTFNGANLGALNYGTYRLFGFTGTLTGNYSSVTMPAGFGGRIDLTTPNVVKLVVNRAPVLATPDPTVGEFGNITFQIIATDDPAEALTYALEPGAPPAAGPPPTATIAGNMVTVNVADGPTIVDVPVRVTDNGNPVQSSVQIVHVNVLNVAPTGTFNNAGSVNEGSSGNVSFTNQADVSPVDTGAGFRYSYDFNNDGTFDSGGVDYASALTSATIVVPAIYFPDGPATLTVRGRIWDKDNGFTDYTTAITVNNVNPTAVLANSGPVNEGTPLATVTIGSPFDPSAADSVEFHYAFDLDNNGFFDIGGNTYLESDTTTSAIVPAVFFDDGPQNVTVRVRVIDKDNGFTDYFTDILVNNVAPVAFMSSIPTVDEGATTSFLMSAQLDPSQADTTAGFKYSYDFNYAGGIPSFDLGGTSYLTAAFTSNPTIPASQIQNGPATQTVLARIWDKDDGFTDYVGTFDINNVPPALSNLNVVTITENGTATLTGTITDPGVNDTFILDVDWNDGTTDSYVLSTPGTQNFSCTHQYLDDDPTSTASDIYIVSVSVTDSDTDSDTQTVNARVNNANPVVSVPAGLLPHISEHSTIGVTTLVTFTDAGTQDLHRATINWGDGQTADSTTDPTIVIVEPSVGNGFVGSVSANHLYDDGPSVYAVTVTVIDDDTGLGSAIVNVIVDNVAPTAVFRRPDAGSATPLKSVEFVNSQDVSVADTNAGFLYSYDFNNDGVFEISLSSSATAVVPDAYLLSHPNHIVHGRIIDKDGGHSDYYLQQPFFASNPIFVEFILGAQSSYTLQATGLPAPTYTIEVVDLPDGIPNLAAIGLSFDGIATIGGVPLVGGMLTLHATATNAGGSETVDLIITIVRPVNSNTPQIISRATANPNPAITGTPIEFSVLAKDDDGDILSYYWTFADGSFARGRVVTHTYTVPGKYVVVVSVSDGKHESTFDQFDLVVAPGVDNLFDVQSAKLSFDFRKADKSTLYVTGYIPIPSGPLDGVIANVSIPGSTYAQAFQFNSKGAAGDTMSLFSVKTVQTGTGTSRAKFVFSLKSTNGTDPLHPSLHQMIGNLFPATTVKTGATAPMPLVVTIGSQPTQTTTIPFLYKVIPNRSGKGQYKRK